MDGSKYNMYRIDDIFIKIGYACLVLFVLTAGTAVSNMIKGTGEDGPRSLYAAAAMLFAPSAVFLLIGYRFRFKERAAATIMKKLETARGVRASDLTASTGYGMKAVEKALLLINRRSRGYYVWDKSTGMIIDGRLRQSMVMVDACKNCGNTIGKSFPVYSSEPPRCPYCSSPFETRQWEEMKQRAVDEINKQELQSSISSRINAQNLKRQPSFSVPIFVVLLLVFWPAAVAYAVTRYNKSG